MQDIIKSRPDLLMGNTLSISITHPTQFYNFINSYDENKTYEIILQEKKEKRSLDANALCWVMCSKIAEVLKTSKEEVYIEALKSFGVSDRVIIPREAFNSLKRSFRYSQIQQEFERKGKMWADCLVIHGSSTYNTKEMSILIDGLIEEAKGLNIDVISPEEKQEILAKWNIEI